MNILITGASGNIGGYLANHLSEQNHNIFGLSRTNPSNLPNYLECDLATVNEGQLSSFIDDNNITTIIHAAAALRVTTPEEFRLNSVAINKLMTLRRANTLKFVVIGSAGEYGLTQDAVITEETLPKPTSPYGESKLLQTTLCSFYRNYYDFDITVLRLFNIIFPIPPVQSFFGHILAEVKKGSEGVININSRDIERDFIDLRDFANLVGKVVTAPRSDLIYNAGTGRNVTYGEALDLLFDILKSHNLPCPTLNIKNQPEAFNTATCDISKAKKDFNWDLQYNLQNSLEWCLKENNII